MASQSADEVALGGRQDMESTALTFNLNEEPYSNPGAVLRELAMDPLQTGGFGGAAEGLASDGG